MAGPTRETRKEGEFPIIVSSPDENEAGEPERDEAGKPERGEAWRDKPHPHPGPSPGLPPLGPDLPDPGPPGDLREPQPHPTRLPGEPATLDDRPLSSED